MTLDDLSRGDRALIDRLPLWRDEPLLYVREAFDWGRGDLAEHPGPDDWQAELLAAVGERLRDGASMGDALRVAVASGHGVGKSALVAWLILWAMSTRPHLNGVVTANTGTQLDTKTWRELAVWHKRSINAHWFRWTATRFAQVDHPETWFVAAIPWAKERSEAFAGQHAAHVLVIYDEASAIDDAIWTVSEGAMTTAGAMWFAFGNPTRNTGRFREAFGRFAHRWMTRQVDSRTARMANQSQIAAWIADYGEDSDFVRVRVRGVFPRAGSAQFIDADTIEAARTRPVDADGSASLVMGVDVARFGDDQSVIRFRQGRDARSLPPLTFRGIDTMQLAGIVAHWANRVAPAAVFVDGNGVGGGVVDRLRQLRVNVIEVQSGAKARNERDYTNKSAEMWAGMRDWLKAGGAVDDSHDLLADLGGREYGFDQNNRLQLEKKDDMKKRGLASPDHADALALTFAEPVGRIDIRRAAPAVAETEYDVFA